MLFLFLAPLLGIEALDAPSTIAVLGLDGLHGDDVADLLAGLVLGPEVLLQRPGHTIVCFVSRLNWLPFRITMFPNPPD